MSEPNVQDPAALQALDERQLWHLWRSEGDVGAREKLAQHYLWLARALAFRFYNEARRDADLDPQELIQIASIGLLEAIDRFDPTRGASFATFGRKRIIGALRDGVDKHTEQRAQLALSRRVRKERRESLVADHDAKDPLSELVDVAVGLAIGMLLEDSPLFWDESAQATKPYHEDELSVLREQFKQIVESLPGRHRDVVRYHYYFDLSFSDIAELMQLSRPRISQLHARALAMLRERFNGLGGFDALA